MQRSPVTPVDPAYVDAIIRRARRDRSDYICGLAGRAARATVSAAMRLLPRTRRPTGYGGVRTA